MHFGCQRTTFFQSLASNTQNGLFQAPCHGSKDPGLYEGDAQGQKFPQLVTPRVLLCWKGQSHTLSRTPVVICQIQRSPDTLLWRLLDKHLKSPFSTGYIYEKCSSQEKI